MFATIVILSVALYFSVRTDNVQVDNDLKYRYVKMKGEATPEQLVELENLFGPNRNNGQIRQIREDVEAYEETIQRKAALTEQARLKDQPQENWTARRNPSRTSLLRTNLKSKPMASVKIKIRLYTAI